MEESMYHLSNIQITKKHTTPMKKHPRNEGTSTATSRKKIEWIQYQAILY